MNHTDRLYGILSSERFLSMQGLANEVPIFIHAYDVTEEDRVASMIGALAARLRNAGIQTAEVDLFKLFLQGLKEADLLDELIADEADYDRRDLRETWQNFAAPTRLVPRMTGIMQETNARLTLLSGIGHLYPALRTHILLNAIQPAMLRHPVVLFFPGEYVQDSSKGFQLRLFGTLPGEGYYRAFNLEHYRLPAV
ncbi:MAG: DUF1788 domain-containing protein [Chthoniobacterales bacterium]|nr:DUF1788 domain-containing protein [Chthoniobacterales bacterium]